MPLEVGKLYQNTHGDLIVCLSHPLTKPLERTGEIGRLFRTSKKISRTIHAGSQVVLALATSQVFLGEPTVLRGYTEVP